jgi:hypothetical protein
MTRQSKLALGLGTAVIAGLALVSCNKAGGGGEAQAFNEAPSSTAYSITPGQYETTIRITNATAQGFPPEMQRNIEQAKQHPQVQRSCIPIGFSLDSFSMKNLRIAFPNNMGGCNLGDLTQEGGNIHGALSCEVHNLPQNRPDSPRNLAISGTMTGTYSANTWNGTAHGEVSEPGGNRSGTIDVEIGSRRVGDCPATPPPMTYAPPPGMNTMAPSPYGGSGNMTTNSTTVTNSTDSVEK